MVIAAALFLVFNAAGGILWAAIYTFGFYYVGSALNRVRGPVDYAIGAAAAVIVIAFIVWTRRNAKRLEAEAEKAYPGPLDDHTDRDRQAQGAAGEFSDGGAQPADPSPRTAA